MEYRIKDLLHARSLTLKDLATKIGVDPSNLSSSLGSAGNPSISRLEKIADALNVDISELFARKSPVYGYLEVLGHARKVANKEDLMEIFRGVLIHDMKYDKITNDVPISNDEEDAFIHYYKEVTQKGHTNFQQFLLLTARLYLNKGSILTRMKPEDRHF